MHNKKIFLLASVFFYTTSHVMSMDLSQKMEEYQNACGLITERHEVKLIQYMQELGSKNLNAEIVRIENKFEKYRLSLQKKEQEACDCIQNCFNIPEENWKRCGQLIQQIKDFNKKTMSFPLSGTTQDESFPLDIQLMLASELKKNGINPQRVQLKVRHMAPSRVRLKRKQPCWEIINGTLHIYEDKTIPGTIAVDVDGFRKLSFEDQQTQCIDAAEAMSQDSETTLSTIAQFISLFAHNENKDDILSRQEFKDARRIFFKNATFYACLKSERAARIIKSHLFNFFNERVMVEDYELVSKIDWQWRALTALRKYVSLAESSNQFS